MSTFSSTSNLSWGKLLWVVWSLSPIRDDAEHSHVYVWEELKGCAIIPSRGRYKKEMKRGYSEMLYRQRNKDETASAWSRSS